MKSVFKRVGAALLLLAPALPVSADKPLFVQTCNRSTLCGATVVQFEEASDYPRRPVFLEPDGQNVSPIGGGSEKLGKYAVQFTGSNFLWASSGGVFGPYFTIALWVYPTVLGSTNQIQYLVSEDGDNIPGNALYLQNQAGLLKAVIDIRDGADPKSGAHVTATWSADISRNAWHLIVARARPQYMKQGATNGVAAGELSIQVDNGTPVTTSVTVPLNTGGGRLFAGKTNTKGSEGYYTGYMDQAAFDGVRWTDDETKQYWNNGGGLDWPFVSANSAYTSPTCSFRGDAASSIAANGGLKDDASGGSDTSAQNGSLSFTAGGPLGYSASVNTNYAPNALLEVVPNSGPWTVEGWFKPTSTLISASPFALGLFDSATTPYLEVYWDKATGKFTLEIYNGTTTYSLPDTAVGEGVSVGTWYYFSARFDGNTTYKVAINNGTGVTGTSSVKWTLGSGNGGSEPIIGAHGHGHPNIEAGGVEVSQVNWYRNVNLSDSELTSRYNVGSGRSCCPTK
jgi:hypothetical protein